MINSPLLPLAYDNSIEENPHKGGGGWAGIINSPLLPLAYDKSIVEPFIRGGGVGCGD